METSLENLYLDIGLTPANTTFILVIHSAIEITKWTTQFLDNFQYISLSV